MYMLYDVFMSYSSMDREIARRIQQALEDRGLRVFRDASVIGSGADIVLTINDALGSTHSVVVLFSPHSLDSNWVKREWASALWLELEKGNSMILVPAMVSPGALLPPLL